MKILKTYSFGFTYHSRHETIIENIIYFVKKWIEHIVWENIEESSSGHEVKCLTV